jgi:hypothetical protein
VLTVTGAEVRSLFSRTSLRSFVLRAAACDRTRGNSLACSSTALYVLLDRLSFGLSQCACLTRLELVDTTRAVYGAGCSHSRHGLSNALSLATRVLRTAPLDSLRVEGVSARFTESQAFWEAISETGRPIRVELVDSRILSWMEMDAASD